LNDNLNRTGSGNMATGFLLGAVVVVLALVGYMILRNASQEEIVRIDAPGFSGSVITDRDGSDTKVDVDVGN
jgi:hypothetical protein